MVIPHAISLTHRSSCLVCSKVMACVDSQAEFARRVSNHGLGEQRDSFLQEGMKCFADLAFAPDYIWQGANSELFVQDLVIPILVSGSSPLRPALRRLSVESYTPAAADLKRRVDPGVEEASPRLPPIDGRRMRP